MDNAKFSTGEDKRQPAEPPPLVVVEFSREWVEAQDITSALEMLEPLISNRASVELFAGTIILCFDDWENDPRELTDIPEVRTWFQQLTTAFPYWFIFCDRASNTLPLVINLLLDDAEVTKTEEGIRALSHSPGAISKMVRILFNWQNTLCARFGIPDDVGARWTREVSDCLNAYTD